MKTRGNYNPWVRSCELELELRIPLRHLKGSRHHYRGLFIQQFLQGELQFYIVPRETSFPGMCPSPPALRVSSTFRGLFRPISFCNFPGASFAYSPFSADRLGHSDPDRWYQVHQTAPVSPLDSQIYTAFRKEVRPRPPYFCPRIIAFCPVGVSIALYNLFCGPRMIEHRFGVNN